MRRRSNHTSRCRLTFDLMRFGSHRLRAPVRSVQIVLQVEESRGLFILKELRRGVSNKPLKHNSFLSVTFGTEITTRPCPDIRPSNNPCATRISTASVFPASMFLPRLNPIEPPWYGPVCPVAWEGWRREVSPYPDLKPDAPRVALAARVMHGIPADQPGVVLETA
jgi:hypothetical protein